MDAVPTLYTAEEAATVLRVRQSWLERQAAARKVPFTMLGGSYRFTTDHLAQIVRIFESTPDPGCRVTASPIADLSPWHRRSGDERSHAAQATATHSTESRLTQP